MPRHSRLLLAVVGIGLGAAACGGGGSGAPTATTAGSAASGATSTTIAPQASIEGEQTFPVASSHTDVPQTYEQVPPAGGAHNPVWTPCAFYDTPVQVEMGVHSLEHGAVWITYRADVAKADLDRLANLARTQKYILVSPWDATLPSPLVATAWGREVRLQSVADPRLVQFILAYAGHGPENAPC